MIPQTFVLASVVVSLAAAVPHPVNDQACPKPSDGDAKPLWCIHQPSETSVNEPSFRGNIQITDPLDLGRLIEPWLPIEASTFPAYANWTDDGWNLRVRGNIYRMFNASEEEIETVAKGLLHGDAFLEPLTELETMLLRNFSRSHFIIPLEGVKVTMAIVDDANIELETGDAAINAEGIAQKVEIPSKTSGSFDMFVQLQNSTAADGHHLVPGNQTSQLQVLNMYAEGIDTSHAAAYLVPEEGITFVSNIDSLSHFDNTTEAPAIPLQPWMNMPDVYANWSAMDDLHFHYIAQRPHVSARAYMELAQQYPPGSFDTALPGLEWNTESGVADLETLLRSILEAFPKRKFILLGDTSNDELMRLYPEIYKNYAGQVLRMLFRGGAMDPSYHSQFLDGIPEGDYVFFNEPNELKDMYISYRNPLNETVGLTHPPSMDVGFVEKGVAGRVTLTSMAALVVACAMAILVISV